jgi:hypothetical protein
VPEIVASAARVAARSENENARPAPPRNSAARVLTINKELDISASHARVLCWLPARAYNIRAVPEFATVYTY